MDQLFAAEYCRFGRSRSELPALLQTLESIFGRKVSGRTERRYRYPTPSTPHVDALIQLTLTNVSRYTDSIRSFRTTESDRGRFSLETLLNTQHPDELADLLRKAPEPTPTAQWQRLRNDYLEWPTLLSLCFPRLQSQENQIVRLPNGASLQGLDPSLAPGSLLLLEKPPSFPVAESMTTGWQRTIYALQKDDDVLCGYLDGDSQQYVLRNGLERDHTSTHLAQQDLSQLLKVSGVAVPIPA